MSDSTDKKELFLLRHGDTGLRGKYIGATDVGLSVKGRQQASRTGKMLGAFQFDKIFCSPMIRCVETLKLIKQNCPGEQLSSLKEVDFGRWEGKDFSTIVAEDPTLVDQWVINPGDFTFPEGESLQQFRGRVADVAKMINETAAAKTLIVSHGGVIRHLLCHLMHLSVENYLLFDIQPGCFSTVQLHEEGGILTGLNLRG
ncbi:MAG: histidine phosphatase family protein [Desulfobulbaceae bacterium]|nr:histidine phosphatase family protein [Desulfobulbaceae bacterium]